MKARPVTKLDPQASLIENAARIVGVRLDELCSFAPDALQPDAAADQHDMRIAAKRLRYVLEATGRCFGPSAETARRRAKDVQDALGELHDCDVMLPRVAEHAALLRSGDAEAIHRRAGDAKDLDPALRPPHRTAYRGLGVLAVHLEARRALMFARFTSLWAEIERAGTWARLEGAIERRLAEARRRRAAAERAERAARELEEAELAQQLAADRARRAAEALVEARRADDGGAGGA